MKILKWMISLGILGVVFFILMDMTGIVLWREYNPITDYMSKYLTEEAPNAVITRTLMNLYNINISVYALGMTIVSFKNDRVYLKVGFSTFLLVSILSLIGYGAIPISLIHIFSANDMIHLAITLALLILTFISICFLSIGFLKKTCPKLGKICSLATGCYAFLNLSHVAAILCGWNILGLIQRLTFYSLHALTVSISWTYIRIQNRYWG